MRRIEQARLGFAYGASYFSYLMDAGPRPFSASFAVTNRCNIACSYCSCPSLDPSELAPEQISVLFARLRQLGVRRLGLVGGEPLVRKDIGEIVRLGKTAGFVVSMNSNLLLYDRNPSSLAEVDLVFTSLDGDAEAHRRNRGERSYEGVVEAIRRLVRLSKPVVSICVVTENNLDQASTLLRLAEEIGFKVHFQPQCVDAVIVQGEIPLTLTNERLRSFWSGLLEEKKRGRPVASSTAYLECLSRWDDFRIPAYYDPNKRCAAGLGFLYIDPKADAYPCAYTKGKTPPVNLLTQDWGKAFGKKTPCTDCNVGPMLEFNLLFRDPLASAADALRTYGMR